MLTYSDQKVNRETTPAIDTRRKFVLTYNRYRFSGEPKSASEAHIFTSTAYGPYPDDVFQTKEHDQDDLLQQKRSSRVNPTSTTTKVHCGNQEEHACVSLFQQH